MTKDTVDTYSITVKNMVGEILQSQSWKHETFVKCGFLADFENFEKSLSNLTRFSKKWPTEVGEGA